MISEILGHGEENAITGKRICLYLQISTRDLTQAIERERRAGIPICASTGSNPGYYLAANKAEMEAYCQSLKHRGIEIFKTRQACLKAVNNLPESVAQ